MKSLVIVGSAPLHIDCLKFIDSCDCVVRFNDCKNFGGNSGTRTDILVLNCTGGENVKAFRKLLQPRSDSELAEELPFVVSASEVWFSRPNPADLRRYYLSEDVADELRSKAVFEKSIDARYRFGALVETLRIPENKIRSITEPLYVSVWEKLTQIGEMADQVPSTGMIGIEMLLNDPRFNEYQKFICGFGWKGWSGHSWKLEKKLVKTYLKSGVFRPCCEPGFLMKLKLWFIRLMNLPISIRQRVGRSAWPKAHGQ